MSKTYTQVTLKCLFLNVTQMYNAHGVKGALTVGMPTAHDIASKHGMEKVFEAN